MKNATTIIMLFMSMALFSQATIDSINKKVFVNNVHQVELTKQEIGDTVKEWIAKTYNNSKYVTRISNDDKVILKGGFNFEATLYDGLGGEEPTNVNVDYDLDVSFKEGRYKMEINNIELDFDDYSVWMIVNSDIGFYLMNKDEYRDHIKSKYENTKGMERAFYKRAGKNDNKFGKQFNRYKELGKEVVKAVYSHLSLIDLAVLNSFGQEKDDDW